MHRDGRFCNLADWRPPGYGRQRTGFSAGKQCSEPELVQSVEIDRGQVSDYPLPQTAFGEHSKGIMPKRRIARINMKTYQAVPIDECNDPLVDIPAVPLCFTQPHPYVVLQAPYGATSPWMLRQRVL